MSLTRHLKCSASPHANPFATSVCSGIARHCAAPCAQAIAIYHKNQIEFGPAKAANAGGVAVSGLEMAQNSARLSWSKEEVDDKLKGIMKSIFNASKSVSCRPHTPYPSHPYTVQAQGNFEVRPDG